MSERICHVGRGRLMGISNNQAQPGKAVTLYDSTAIVAHFPLDKAFPDREVISTENSESVTNTEPGIVLNLIFMRELRCETDGTLEIYWSAPD